MGNHSEPAPTQGAGKELSARRPVVGPWGGSWSPLIPPTPPHTLPAFSPSQ